MQVIVVLDANAIVSDPLLRNGVWSALREAISEGRVRVVVPKFAFDEAVEAYRRDHAVQELAIRKTIRRNSAAVREHLEAAAQQVTRESNEYKRVLSKAFKDAGVSIEKAPHVSHTKLVGRAIARTRPFSDDGSGYRDALHWFFVLGILDQFADESGGEVVFVSNDLRAYGAGTRDSEGRHTLHSHLVQDLVELDVAWAFTWIQALQTLEVPGQFIAGPAALPVGVSDWDVAMHVFGAISNVEQVELGPAEFGAPEYVDGIIVTDISDPHIVEISARQYYADEKLNVEFAIRMDVEVVAQWLAEESAGPELRQEIMTRPVLFRGSLDAEIWRGQLGAVTIKSMTSL